MELEATTKYLIHRLLIENRDMQRELAAMFWARDHYEYRTNHVRQMADSVIRRMNKAEKALAEWENATFQQ